MSYNVGENVKDYKAVNCGLRDQGFASILKVAMCRFQEQFFSVAKWIIQNQVLIIRVFIPECNATNLQLVCMYGGENGKTG